MAQFAVAEAIRYFGYQLPLNHEQSGGNPNVRVGDHPTGTGKAAERLNEGTIAVK